MGTLSGALLSRVTPERAWGGWFNPARSVGTTMDRKNSNGSHANLSMNVPSAAESTPMYPALGLGGSEEQAERMQEGAARSNSLRLLLAKKGPSPIKVSVLREWLSHYPHRESASYLL